MSQAVYCSDLSAAHESNEINALSDDILVKMLALDSGYRMRAVLPLVCKRWRDAIYSAKGSSIYRSIHFSLDMEHDAIPGRCTSKPSPSICAVARWIHKNIERGNIEYPFRITISSHEVIGLEGVTRQELATLLAIVGNKLHHLLVPGNTGLLDNFNFSYLYTVPTLRHLFLKRVRHRLDHTEVQRDFACLRNLEYLLISVDEGYGGIAGLSTFPTVLCSLQHLTHLTLWGHLLGRLPQEVSKLANLADLSIMHGTIEHAEAGHLPAVLGHLTRLKSLDLTHCLELVDQPEAGARPEISHWRSMTQLTCLALDGDYETSEGQLPPEVAELTGLQRLRLQDFTKLENQPRLSALRSLTEISVTDSTATHLPTWISLLPKLSKFELCRVHLSAWVFPGSTTLQELGYSSCNVAEVTDIIGQLTGLTSLTFTECPLKELSGSISRLQNLRYLRLEGSFFPEFPSALHALRAPQLRSVNLTASLGWQGSLRPPGWRAGRYGQKYSAMPVHAKDLAWLLHHPCLEEVTITATKAEAAALQGFREELTSICGRDALSIDTYG